MRTLRRAIEIACLLSLMALGCVLLPVFFAKWMIEERRHRREMQRVLRGGYWNHEERAA